MQFETGIYSHFGRDDLYFADGLEVDDSNDNKLRVRFHALYTKCKLPFSRSLDNFGERMSIYGLAGMTQTSRFILVHPLPPEKLHMLLPGTLAGEKLEGIPCIATFQVEKVRAAQAQCQVELRELCCGSIVSVPLEEYLEKFHTSAE